MGGSLGTCATCLIIGPMLRVAPCHAMSWFPVPCHILACRAMPHFGVSYSLRCHVNIFHEIQKSIVNPEIHRQSIVLFNPTFLSRPTWPACVICSGIWSQTFCHVLSEWVHGCKICSGIWSHLLLACHVLNVACHGVSISMVSISSVSCRV